MEHSYRSILKGSSALGGVQAFQMLCSVAKMKVVALLLGPAGMGVASLFLSASQTLQQGASLGLNMTLTRELGAASGEAGRIAQLVAAGRRLLWLTSLLGLLACVGLAPWLSELTFGNRDWTLGFVLLGAAVFFQVFSTGEMAMLQGLHDIRAVARTNFFTAVAGLVSTVPLYWLMGQGGIVPALVLMAFLTAAWNRRSLRRALGDLKVPRFKWREGKALAGSLLATGMVLMSTDLLSRLGSYCISLVVNRVGAGPAEVGMYQAAVSLTTQLSSVVFMVMSVDYLPRLSATVRDDRAMAATVNRQMRFTAMAIAPVGVGLVVLAPLAMSLLYSERFLPAVPLLRWLGLGITLRALMYPLSYIALAKGNRKRYFWLETVWLNLLTVGLSVGFFLLWGLQGLGMASAADCALCLGIYYWLNRRWYGFRFERRRLLELLGAVGATGAALGGSFLLSGWGCWVFGGAALAGVGAFCGREILRMYRERE